MPELIANKVDKDGLKYHCDMIAIYLDDIRNGVDRQADIPYHLRQIELLFADAELMAHVESAAVEPLESVELVAA